MKVKKVEDVKYNISDEKGDLQLSMKWKAGEIYIAMSNLLLRDGETWYEIPVKDLENIKVTNEKPLQLSFKMPYVEVNMSGDRANRLLALRHFLLPYIKEAPPAKDELMESFLKFWGVGITESGALSILLEVEVEKVEELHKTAYGKGYLNKRGKITEGGLALFSGKDQDMLIKGGRCE